jgi:hypothetical protein
MEYIASMGQAAFHGVNMRTKRLKIKMQKDKSKFKGLKEKK